VSRLERENHFGAGREWIAGILVYGEAPEGRGPSGETTGSCWPTGIVRLHGRHALSSFASASIVGLSPTASAAEVAAIWSNWQKSKEISPRTRPLSARNLIWALLALEVPEDGWGDSEVRELCDQIDEYSGWDKPQGPANRRSEAEHELNQVMASHYFRQSVSESREIMLLSGTKRWPDGTPLETRLGIGPSTPKYMIEWLEENRELLESEIAAESEAYKARQERLSQLIARRDKRKAPKARP